MRRVSRDELVAAARAYAAESADFTRNKVSFIDNWLRGGKWHRHVDDLRRTHAEKEASAAKRVKQIAHWIRDRHGMCKHLTEAQVRETLGLELITLEEATAAGFFA